LGSKTATVLVLTALASSLRIGTSSKNTKPEQTKRINKTDESGQSKEEKKRTNKDCPDEVLQKFPTAKK